MTYIDPILMDFLSSGDNTSEMPQITLTFKELLIKATFHNNYELVCELLEWDEFDESIIHDVKAEHIITVMILPDASNGNVS